MPLSIVEFRRSPSGCQGRLIGINTAIISQTEGKYRHWLGHTGQHGEEVLGDLVKGGGLKEVFSGLASRRVLPFRVRSLIASSQTVRPNRPVTRRHANRESGEVSCFVNQLQVANFIKPRCACLSKLCRNGKKWTFRHFGFASGFFFSRRFREFSGTVEPANAMNLRFHRPCVESW